MFVSRDRSGILDVRLLFGKPKHNYDAYKTHINNIGIQFNSMLESNRYCVDCFITVNDILKQDDASLRKNQHVNNFLSQEGSIDGRIYDTTIVTIGRMLEQIGQNNRQNGVLIAPTSSGKTTTASALHIVTPIISHILDKTYFIHRYCPNKKSLEEQTCDDFSAFLELYGQIKIHTPKDADGITIEEYYMASLRCFYPELDEIEIDKIRYSASCLRRQKSATPKTIIDNCRKVNAAALFVLDEPHHGSESGGVMDELLKLSDMFHKDGADFSIGTTATPYELNTPNIWQVRAKLYPSYHGYNFMNGKVIDPTLDIKHPEHISLTEFALKYKIKNLNLINPMALKSDRGFEKALKMQKEIQNKNKSLPEKKQRKLPYDIKLPNVSYKTYKNNCIQAIADMLRILLVTENPKKGKGAIVRLFSNNEIIKPLTNSINALIPEIKILDFYANEGKQKVKKFIAKNRDDRPYAIFVTGAARMADLFPPDCRYAIEFSNTSNLQAIQQGLPGRLCGHGKEDTLFIGQNNTIAILDYFVNNVGQSIKSPAPRTKTKNSAAHIITNNGEMLSHDEWTNLENILLKGLRKFGKSWAGTYYDIQHILDKLNAKFQALNEQVSLAKVCTYQKDKIMKIDMDHLDQYFVCAYFGKKSSRGASANTEREEFDPESSDRMNYVKNKEMKFSPVAHFEVKRGKPKYLKSFKVRIHNAKFLNEYGPNHKSMWKDEEENDME